MKFRYVVIALVLACATPSPAGELGDLPTQVERPRIPKSWGRLVSVTTDSAVGLPWFWFEAADGTITTSCPT